MNALIRKEVRLLLPNFAAGLLLTLVIWLLPNGVQTSRSTGAVNEILMAFPFVFCPALAVMMALSSFGRELSNGTFSLLLAQPMARSRLWRTKTLLLAAALAVMLGLWLLSFTIHFRELIATTGSSDPHLGMTAALFTLAIYSGGLWTALLFRQVVAAFWFMLLTPAALTMFIVSLFNDHTDGPQPALTRALVIALSLYGVVGFIFARWLFLRAQDTHWTGGTIALPDWRGRRRAGSSSSAKLGHRPRRALFRKELQSHQSQLVIAAVLALLHLGVLALRKFGHLKSSPVLQLVAEGFWTLWFVMPLLIGCAAVAEERKMGTWEAQLCLPARRRTQFMLKLLGTLLLSVLLGAVMPLLFEGTRILPAPSAGQGHFPTGTGFLFLAGDYQAVLEQLFPLLQFAALAAGIALVSFYASTFSRNTLQAIAPAVLGVLAACFLWAAASDIGEILHFQLWRGPLIFILGVPVMTLTVAGLMYGNFRQVLVGWNVWRRNALVLLAALAGVAAVTTGIYQRPWELFSELETPHGAARLNFSQPVRLQVERGVDLTVQFLDGRNWSGRPEFQWGMINLNGLLSPDWSATQMKSAFLDETNWASLVRGFPSTVGVQKDGSLWVSDPPPVNPGNRRRGQIIPPWPPGFVRLGTENDWKSVANQNGPFLLLKTDGTLWRFGTNNMRKFKVWPGLLAFTPERLGTDSDWADISSELGNVFLRKTDGRAWTTQQTGTAKSTVLDLNKEVRLYRAAHLDRVRSFKPTWAESRRGQNFQVGIFEDGTFRVIAAWRRSGFEHSEIQLGSESNWRAVAGNGSGVVTLRADGTLWKWSFAVDPEAKPQAARATRFSTQSDWVAITSAMGGVVALAADGSLWFWRFDPVRYFSSNRVVSSMFAPTRRPQLIGNIFATSPQ